MQRQGDIEKIEIVTKKTLSRRVVNKGALLETLNGGSIFWVACKSLVIFMNVIGMGNSTLVFTSS